MGVGLVLSASTSPALRSTSESAPFRKASRTWSGPGSGLGLGLGLGWGLGLGLGVGLWGDSSFYVGPQFL